MPRLRHIKASGYPVFITTRTITPILKEERFAFTVEEAIFFGRDKGWYLLLSYIIMTDHMHLVIIPKERDISKIMQGIKGFASRIINERLGKTGSIWQTGFYDYLLDSEEKLFTKIRYLEDNPVRKGLVSTPEEYRFSSAQRRDMTDLKLFI
ncbi:MAG TPA: REP-associated tyrosine transposase [Candidatus Hypogeohydataceae bacterium YC38]